MKKKIVWESLHIDDIDDDENEDSEEGYKDEEFYFPLGKPVNTPFGIFPKNDKFNPLRQFECRLGYTNFNISKNVAEIIENTEGVEALVIISRYRFLISVGKLFDFSNIRKELDEKLCEETQDEKVNNQIQNKITEISKDSKYWALYMFPNGNMESVSTNNFEEYEEKVKVLKNCEALSHGVLVEYE